MVLLSYGPISERPTCDFMSGLTIRSNVYLPASALNGVPSRQPRRETRRRLPLATPQRPGRWWLPPLVGQRPAATEAGRHRPPEGPRRRVRALSGLRAARTADACAWPGVHSTSSPGVGP